MLQTIVKAGGITHLTDARYFAAWYVDYLGFPLAGSDAISPPQLAAMREWIEGPKVLAELDWVNDADELINQLQQHGLLNSPVAIDGLQLGMLTPTEILPSLKAAGLELWQEIVVEHYRSLEEIEEYLEERQSYCSTFLINYRKGGIGWEEMLAGTGPSMEKLASWSKEHHLYVAIDLPPTAITDWVQELPQVGLALRGSAEEQVGYKSFDELDEVFEALAD
ncbi:MAG: hypothetical protein AAF433_11230 [Bacteroidota bacterium]